MAGISLHPGTWVAHPGTLLRTPNPAVNEPTPLPLPSHSNSYLTNYEGCCYSEAM